jgi:hypothetical protein
VAANTPHRKVADVLRRSRRRTRNASQCERKPFGRALMFTGVPAGAPSRICTTCADTNERPHNLTSSGQASQTSVAELSCSGFCALPPVREAQPFPDPEWRKSERGSRQQVTPTGVLNSIYCARGTYRDQQNPRDASLPQPDASRPANL